MNTPAKRAAVIAATIPFSTALLTGCADVIYRMRDTPLRTGLGYGIAATILVAFVGYFAALAAQLESAMK